MNIDKRLCFFLSFTFILFTIAGTLFHELGHYLVLKLLGYNGIIRYNSTHPLTTNGQIMTNKEYYLMILGGPLQTMITGTLGLTVLLIDYKNIRSSDKLSLFQWFFVFITLFWLRQLANLFILIGRYLISGKFSHAGDEANLDDFFHLPFPSTNILTAVIGAIILSIVFYKFIPETQRKTFIVSGLIGGITGFIFWMSFLGPSLLP